MLSPPKFMLSLSKQNLIALNSNLIAPKLTTSAQLKFFFAQ